MCGITGFFNPNGVRYEHADKIARNMGQAIFHRGPDDSGVWIDSENGIALVHQRLSILDLSPAGHQPMMSHNDKYVIVFNGEIYNHLKIRSEIENGGKIEWAGHSDTEILLAGFELWGIENTIKKAIGMFSIAVWSKNEQQLYLIRDRIGEKPLYYGWQGDDFLFGSELKAFKMHPSFCSNIDRGSLTLYIRHNYVPAPWSIFQGIFKLQPGTILTVSGSRREPAVKPYWSFTETAMQGLINGFAGSKQDAVNELERLMLDTVSMQMMADVPLGAFLSGGIDSSTIVALMQIQSSRPVKTFTIGFSEKGYNEAEYAKAVASHLRTDHTELYVPSCTAMDVIPRLPVLYDEPYADSSQIPTFLVSQLASQHVTVSLSGDAGDELFCGYNRYLMTDKIWNLTRYLPGALRKIIAHVIMALPSSGWEFICNALPSQSSLVRLPDRIQKVAGLLRSINSDELYLGLVSHDRNPEEIVRLGSEHSTYLTGFRPDLYGMNNIERMMAIDVLTYLVDDILVKVDRAAMGVSLETRVPFLNHQIVEFAWSLPLEYKLNNGVSKWPLRQILYKYVPRELIERPKMGFGIPLAEWLRGPLREWSEYLLSPRRIIEEGFFNNDCIQKIWQEHVCGKKNNAYLLWNFLMFQAWLDNIE